MTDLFVSPYVKVGGLVYFARMLRKIRLQAENRLPRDYQPFLGKGFDARTTRFLRVNYDDLVRRTLAGGTDEEVLDWCFAQGYRPTDTEVLVWNEYMIKRGWRDTDVPPEKFRAYKEEWGLGHRADILTYFDFYEVDEGRRP